MTIVIGDNSYTIEFRHVTKLGKRALLRRGPVKAVTTCVIVMHEMSTGDLKLIAIDNAICSEADNFSRRQGRLRSLRKVIDRCGALKDVKAELWSRYLLATPLRPARGKEKPDAAAIDALKNAPEAIDKRQRRQKLGRYAQ